MLIEAYVLFAVVAVLFEEVFAGLPATRFAELSKTEFQRFNRRRTDTPTTRRSRFSDFRFLNNNTEKYRVDSLPDVHFDVGELYSGNIAIDESDPSRNLFFVYQPTVGEATDEIVIWLNGGPGSSSLVGFFQENGRWTWQPGTFLPVENPYSWVNLTNMLWVEQPVGTGFSQGLVNATSQEDTAQDFIKFFKNFERIFGIKNFKIYVTGESYAGRYVPYISAAMLNEKDKEYYNLDGAIVYDPNIGDGLQVQTVVPFVHANSNVFNFNSSMMATLNSLDKSCGFEAYREKYLAFPPTQRQPDMQIFFGNETMVTKCNILEPVIDAVFEVNPCFNKYEIIQQCPLPWDVLGVLSDPNYYPVAPAVYFNRTDVKKAMHAPINYVWEAHSSQGVGTDDSGQPIEHVLPQVIEATNRVLIGSGDFDMVLITNGTLLSIQNMTWNGQLGFQQRPKTPIIIDQVDLQYQKFNANISNVSHEPQGTMGIQHYERGLMWAETFLSGHMEPEFQPRSTYRHLEWLLRRSDHL